MHIRDRGLTHRLRSALFPGRFSAGGMSNVLSTARLDLREMHRGDLDFIASMLAHPEVLRYYPQTYSRREAKDWIGRQQERYALTGHGFWLVLEKTTGRPMGQAGLLMTEIDGVEETALGYMLHRPFWRRGYATEAAAACLGYAFESLDRRRVICPVRPENGPSRRVALRLGMKPEKSPLVGGYEHMIFSTHSRGS